MASNPTTGSLTSSPVKSGDMSLTDIARAIVSPLASLKLTVFLLAFAVFAVWVITLEQTRMDFHELKEFHFRNAIVYVPFQTFLPPGKFPDLQNVGGGFWIPSGFTLIVCMLINLTSAHLLRFRIQARGIRLVMGLITMVAATLLTWAVIFSGQSPDGFQQQPPIRYEKMWAFLQVALCGLTIATIAGCVVLPKQRLVERIVLGVFGLMLAGVLGATIYYGEQAFIGDSAMRILWQLLQSSLAAGVGLLACVLIFKRKAGMVLLHLGIAGLMFNEIYVSVTNEEQILSFVEGESVSYAVDLRATEFAIIDRSDPDVDTFTVIPGQQIQNSVRNGSKIDEPDVPFVVECLKYMPNSELSAIGPMQENLADRGIGKSTQATLRRAVTGTDVDRRSDRAAAYVRISNRKSGALLGNFLVSQQIYENDFVDPVEVDGKSYFIGLRLKHIYKPYDVKLDDVKAEYYPGTGTPRHFASNIVITNREDGMSSEQKIWMNNPLRYRNETFYQTNYAPLPDGSESSSLQVVKNRGWMIPYVCCMFVMLGLMYQFGATLLKFLEKSGQEISGALGATGGSTTVPPAKDGFLKRWLPWALVAFFGLWCVSTLGRAASTKVDKEGMKLELLGQVPVTYGGRVQPMDSLARNLARQFSNRENVGDGSDAKKRPAIEWFADTMFGKPGFEEYHIMRVEDLNVQNALGLERRKGLKYSWKELQDGDAKMVELLREATDLPSEQWSNFQRRLNELYGKSRKLLTISRSMQDSSHQCESPHDDLERLEVAAENNGTFTRLMKNGTVPLAFPSASSEEWLPLATAIDRLWLARRAEHYGTNNVDKLGREMVRTAMTRASVINLMLGNEEVVELLGKELGLKDKKEIANKIAANWDDMPEELYKSSLPRIEKDIDELLAKRPAGKDDPFSQMIRKIVGEDQDAIVAPDSEFIALAKLQEAYLKDDAATFNETLESYLAAIGETPPSRFRQGRNRMEIIYNAFSPFYIAMVIYVFAFMVTILSWMLTALRWRVPFNRAAFWLIVLGLVVHVGGIVARVFISGRPPITNLYSSYVVVAAFAVFMLLIIERIVKIGVGNLMAGFFGFIALMFAWTLSIDSGDTYTVLVAVLDTQFWLSTHVMSISIGYGATLVAGMVGLSLLAIQLAGPGSRDLVKILGKIVYGVVCFALLFSFFGTVLGGLWADDSWGRFWGWDPKENGALMIVLWNALGLHARWAGLVRERGLAALAAFGNIVTLWSWEGVNQLGVGLHAYSGLTEGASAGSIFMEPTFYMMLFVAVNLLACATVLIPLKAEKKVAV